MVFKPELFSQHLDRIIALNGTDEGFYVLALHSLVEAYADAYSPDIEICGPFWEKLDLLYHHLGLHGQNTSMKAARRICQEHMCVNRVRHGFCRLSSEEAIGATRNFLEFCRDARWHHEKLETLQQTLSLWEEKKTPMERQTELVRLRHEVRRMSEENRDLFRKAALSHAGHDEMEEIRRGLQRKIRENQELHERLESRKDKSDQLRKQLHEAKEEKKSLAGRLEQLEINKLYLSYLERYTVYTKTRADYERSVIQLTPEQRKAAERIKDTGDYLVRGPAGTGKTLVLLHALDEQLSIYDASFEFAKEEDLVLLTYTNSLVRFNTYLSHILGKYSKQPQVNTVDRFLIRKLQEVNSSYSVDYSLIREQVKDTGITFLTEKELAAEIETAIFGRDLDRPTYVEAPGARTGMKGSLSRAQKEQVWELAEMIRKHMVETGRFSKSFSRLVLLNALTSDEDLCLRLSARRLFIDEVQDLSPIETKLLRKLSSSGLVLAGDEDQAIYQAGFSFRQMGVNIVGRSVLLSGNYRNTRQISRFAEKYRRVSGLTSEDTAAFAFREGPSPELWQEEHEQSLIDTLLKRITFFISVLQYDPENLAVLVPSKKLVEHLCALLSSRGYETHDIRSEDFDFDTTPGIRVSTFHSAKGVEFPVVMVYAPDLPVSDSISRESAEKSCRNLVYMTLTRAMENLQIFMLRKPVQEITGELSLAFELYLTAESEEDEIALTGMPL